MSQRSVASPFLPFLASRKIWRRESPFVPARERNHSRQDCSTAPLSSILLLLPPPLRAGPSARGRGTVTCLHLLLLHPADVFVALRLPHALRGPRGAVAVPLVVGL
eukprot:866475-Rhodomonas_salina.1